MEEAIIPISKIQPLIPGFLLKEILLSSRNRDILMHTLPLLLVIALAVFLQLWTATLLQNDGWLKILATAYFFGSFLNHNLFLAIHELSHNLAFSTPVYNRWLGIFANLPIGVPMSVTFQKYHLEHHRFQGVDGIAMDVPSNTEAHLVTNAVAKT
ncbi:sphingolipid delta(4)-desaturase DES1-like [Alnus glutinosa]|uniref:sphingolipid delta(4)-desaturase DES1-like n=1 Tax=Alnus glutinosa TaxID=3517 RepID=UPI002D7A2818|nr:sphingolipid delta(4)-desaturase DES1-like [Alnus glutinosa]